MSNLDPSLLFKWAMQGLLALAALTFVIQWLLPRWRKYFRFQQVSSHSENEMGENSVDEERKKRKRERLQQDHAQKASSYMDRILIPREEAKQKKKEEDFEKFTGWKGKGELLGGKESDDEDSTETESSLSQLATRRRKVKSLAQPKPKTEPKKKDVIKLPDEPPEGDKNSVVVKLRTPVGRMCQRRFLNTHTVQVLMDYMTTLGFRQSHYTISTSYPKRNLSEYLNKTMWEMGFQGQVTLNVEEKEE